MLSTAQIGILNRLARGSVLQAIDDKRGPLRYLLDGTPISRPYSVKDLVSSRCLKRVNDAKSEWRWQYEISEQGLDRLTGWRMP